MKMLILPLMLYTFCIHADPLKLAQKGSPAENPTIYSTLTAELLAQTKYPEDPLAQTQWRATPYASALARGRLTDQAMLLPKLSKWTRLKAWLSSKRSGSTYRAIRI